MVVLYVSGRRVGVGAEVDRLLPEIAASNQLAEFRDEDGRLIGRFVPASEPLCPWEPDLTADDVTRRIAQGGGTTLAEFWKRTGAG